MRTYSQYCPIARSAEVFAERWTPIIVRNILLGCETFTEIQKGAPGIPRSLLAQRLMTLERAGIIERLPVERGRGFRYLPTEAGKDLWAVCVAMGEWLARRHAGPPAPTAPTRPRIVSGLVPMVAPAMAAMNPMSSPPARRAVSDPSGVQPRNLSSATR